MHARCTQLALLTLALSALAFIACGGDDDDDDAVAVDDPGVAGASVEFEIGPVDESGVRADAELTNSGAGTTTVLLNFEGYGGDDVAPVAIHAGSKCGEPGPVAFPLEDVVEGESATRDVASGLAHLQDSDYVIVARRGLEDSTIVACASIPNS